MKQKLTFWDKALYTTAGLMATGIVEFMSLYKPKVEEFTTKIPTGIFREQNYSEFSAKVKELDGKVVKSEGLDTRFILSVPKEHARNPNYPVKLRAMDKHPADGEIDYSTWNPMRLDNEDIQSAYEATLAQKSGK